jgi:hypothetical protein
MFNGDVWNAKAPMTRIAKNIELYNLAHRLAWKHISESQKCVHPNTAWSLHDSIRRQLKEGAVEPVLIASEALRDIEEVTGSGQSGAPADRRRC